MALPLRKTELLTARIRQVKSKTLVYINHPEAEVEPATSMENSSRSSGRFENIIINGSSPPGLISIFDLLSPTRFESRFLMASRSILESSISDKTFPQKTFSVWARIFPFLYNLPLMLIKRRTSGYPFLTRPVITKSLPSLTLSRNLLFTSKESILRLPLGSETLGLK
jgi:hypothetical protein